MQYDRNFLLQLQFVAGSIEKPAGLPKLPDVILDAVSNAFSTRLNFLRGDTAVSDTCISCFIQLLTD